MWVIRPLSRSSEQLFEKLGKQEAQTGVREDGRGIRYWFLLAKVTGALFPTKILDVGGVCYASLHLQAENGSFHVPNHAGA